MFAKGSQVVAAAHCEVYRDETRKLGDVAQISTLREYASIHSQMNEAFRAGVFKRTS